MQFDSFTFLLFLTITLLLHASLRAHSSRKNLLLFMSLVFYAGWNPWFLPLLIGTSSLDFWIGRRMARIAQERRRPWLMLSLVANLSVLAFFKYRYFIMENVDAALGTGLLEAMRADARAAWVLPVGISFYTFQSMSYCIDCYRGSIGKDVTWRDFTLYVAFFPQLVAGPIVRFLDFHPQLQNDHRANASDLGTGFCLLVLGLFLKIVLADSIFAPAGDQLFSASALDWHLAMSGTLAFSGQIFCDFAGYSTCAIGCARMLGFRLIENFNAPYAAIGFSDFWRRWHISLSSWLRDYLYIPLGGNRHGTVRTYFALGTTMLLGGLWHGAAWNYVAWGALHGGYLMLERFLKPWLPKIAFPGAHALAWLLTLGAAMLAWIYFRAGSIVQAHEIIATLAQWPIGWIPPAHQPVWLAFFALVGMHLAERRFALSTRWLNWPAFMVALLLAAMMVSIALSPGNSRAFIYFQF